MRYADRHLLGVRCVCVCVFIIQTRSCLKNNNYNFRVTCVCVCECLFYPQALKRVLDGGGEKVFSGENARGGCHNFRTATGLLLLRSNRVKYFKRNERFRTRLRVRPIGVIENENGRRNTRARRTRQTGVGSPKRIVGARGEPELRLGSAVRFFFGGK